jgi:hypothetical protein
METKPKHKELDNRQQAFMDKAINDPDSLTDEEVEMFMQAMREESDSNIMKHYNPRI